MKSVRPVVDPSLPPDERGLLALGPQGLTPATAARPARPRWGGRTWGDVCLSSVAATSCGFLPVVALPFLLGRVGLAVGAVVQAALATSWLLGGFGLFLLVGTGSQLACCLVFVARCGEGREQRLGRERHGRYYLETDFDERSLLFVSRAQDAVAAVLDSQVNAAGLLDDMANAVALPEQAWEIAQTCAELTRIEGEMRGIARRSGAGSRVNEMLQPQRHALKLSAQAVERRVAALERYAERTKAADAAYREWLVMEELEELGAEARELLARTVRDDLAVAEIDGLAEKAPLAQLRRRVQDALRAGLDLAGPTDSEEPSEEDDLQDKDPGRTGPGSDKRGRKESGHKRPRQGKPGRKGAV